MWTVEQFSKPTIVAQQGCHEASTKYTSHTNTYTSFYQTRVGYTLAVPLACLSENEATRPVSLKSHKMQKSQNGKKRGGWRAQPPACIMPKWKMTFYLFLKIFQQIFQTQQFPYYGLMGGGSSLLREGPGIYGDWTRLAAVGRPVWLGSRMFQICQGYHWNIFCGSNTPRSKVGTDVFVCRVLASWFSLPAKWTL